jgi:small nuclear ribonucleoprotein (snRNP)-like protein
MRSLSNRISAFPPLFFFPATICVVTSDGRTIIGTLVGNDQVQNLILSDAQERVYSFDAPVETVDLGLYVIRGDNVCIVADFDKEKLDDSPAMQLPSLYQQQN